MSSETPSHNAKDPLAWVVQHTGHIAEGGRVLDVACGSGRHTRYLLDLGFRVTAIDRDISRLADIIEDESLRVLEYDLEDGTRWPLPGETFDGIVITNYLFRPLFPRLAEALSEGGVLIYQTFAAGNEAYGKPRNPDFLLLENELQEFFGEKFKVLAFHQGFVETPSPAVVQRICCRK